MNVNAAMLANAFNNYQRDRIAYPQATIDSTPSLRDVFGNRLIAVETIPASELRLAMDAYAKETDWTAFSRDDFATAYATL